MTGPDAAEFARIAPLLALFRTVETMGVRFAADLTFLLPDDLHPGETVVYGLPVERYDGVPAIALRPRPVTGSDEE